jgi:hypothetical protein
LPSRPVVSGKQVCGNPDAFFSPITGFLSSGLPFFLVFGVSVPEFCLNCAPGSGFQVNFADTIRKFSKNTHRDLAFLEFPVIPRPADNFRQLPDSLSTIARQFPGSRKAAKNKFLLISGDTSWKSGLPGQQN